MVISFSTYFLNLTTSGKEESQKYLNILRTKRAFQMKQKLFSKIFKGFFGEI